MPLATIAGVISIGTSIALSVTMDVDAFLGSRWLTSGSSELVAAAGATMRPRRAEVWLRGEQT